MDKTNLLTADVKRKNRKSYNAAMRREGWNFDRGVDESSSDFGSSVEDAAADEARGGGPGAAWHGRRGLLRGLKYGLAVGSGLALVVLMVWLHLVTRVELDKLRRQVTRGQHHYTCARHAHSTHLGLLHPRTINLIIREITTKNNYK